MFNDMFHKNLISSPVPTDISVLLNYVIRKSGRLSYKLYYFQTSGEGRGIRRSQLVKTKKKFRSGKKK